MDDQTENIGAQKIHVPETMEPGVYFNMPDDEYLKARALSNSGIKKLRVSPLDYWVDTPWLNPDAEVTKTKYTDEGTAWHKRVLEGPELFYEFFAADIEKSDYPNAISSLQDLQQACEEHGLKKGGNKEDLKERLRGAGADVQFWDDIVEKHRADNAGKTLLPWETVKNIEWQAAHIEKHPDISRCFRGGYPEVSVFWETEMGVPMKARIDYFKPKAIIELKTFSNKYGKPIDRAIASEFANYRYHLQAAFYWEAMRKAVEFMQEGRIFGEVDPEWIKRAMASDYQDRHFVFVFQQTGKSPVARAKIFPRGTVWDIAHSTIQQATIDWINNWQHFGFEPWVDMTPITEFSDTDFPAYIAEA